MKTAVLAFSARGCETAEKIAACLPECRKFTVLRLLREGFSAIPSPSGPFYGELFSEAEALIFVGACGIAVRSIAPFVKSKCTDPAVLAVDEGGQYVIPLLSGHIGGANALSRKLAQQLGAVAVVTTATDCSHKFSVDAWAAANACAISDMGLAKAVSAAILERDLPLYSDFPVQGDYPSGIFPADRGELGVCISSNEKKPFFRTLNLIPRRLHLGIGCRKGTPAEKIAQAVDTVLAEWKLDPRGLRGVYSIDLKREEAGLLSFCAQRGLPGIFYSAQQLNEVEGEFTPSEFVRSITGTDNVCERAALREADTLLVRKTALDGVTVAVAAEEMEVRFG